MATRDDVITLIGALKNTTFLTQIVDVHWLQTLEINDARQSYYYDLAKKKRKHTLLKTLIELINSSDIATINLAQLYETLNNLWAIEYPPVKYFSWNIVRSRTKAVLNTHLNSLSNLLNKLQELPQEIDTTTQFDELGEKESSQQEGDSSLRRSDPTPFSSIFSQLPLARIENGADDAAQETYPIQIEKTLFRTIQSNLEIPEAFSAIKPFNSTAFFIWLAKQTTLTIKTDKYKTLLKHVLMLEKIPETQCCDLLCLCIQDSTTFFKLKLSAKYLHKLLCIFSDKNQNKIIGYLMQTPKQSIFTIESNDNPYDYFLSLLGGIFGRNRKIAFFKLLPFYIDRLSTSSTDALSFKLFGDYIENYTRETSGKLSWDDFMFVGTSLLLRDSEVITFSDTVEKEAILRTVSSLCHRLTLAIGTGYDALVEQLCDNHPVINSIRVFIVNFYQTEKAWLEKELSQKALLGFLEKLEQKPIRSSRNSQSPRSSVLSPAGNRASTLSLRTPLR